LIALSPGDLGPTGHAAFLGALERALAAGLSGVCLREPRLADRVYLTLAHAVAERCRRFPGRWLAVHDRAHLAPALGADGVHLGFRSLAPAVLRPWLGDGIALGLSTHAGDDPHTWDEADYVFHGPLHVTPGKARPVPPVGFDGLGRAVRATARPVLALGGVGPADVPRLLELGVHGVAVRARILGDPEPARATRAFLAALG
jgi:thiamine-phosphate pyrophosphorylase